MPNDGSNGMMTRAPGDKMGYIIDSKKNEALKVCTVASVRLVRIALD